MEDTTMKDFDFGYFGTGDEGYAQYMTAFERNFSTDNTDSFALEITISEDKYFVNNHEIGIEECGYLSECQLFVRQQIFDSRNDPSRRFF